MNEGCELPRDNPPSPEIRDILRSARVIAVVGLSDKPDRDSYHVAEYLQQQGYRIIPINPAIREVLGERAHSRLEDVPEQIDIVDVFRRPDAVPAVVDSAIAIGAKVVWLQKGIVHNEAAEKARQAGLQMVQSKCLLEEHRALGL